MSNQSFKTAVRERMAATGENFTTARRVLRDTRRADRPTGKIDTARVRAYVTSTWARYYDGTGRPALVTDTIPGLCDEIDTLRAMERAVSDLAADASLPEAVRERLVDALGAEPVRITVPLRPLTAAEQARRPVQTAPLVVLPRRVVPFAGGSTQAEFFRAAAARVKRTNGMGSNLAQTVVDVLGDYAEALDSMDGTSPRPSSTPPSSLAPRAAKEPSALAPSGHWVEYVCTDEIEHERIADRLAQGRTVMAWDDTLWQVLWNDSGDEWWGRSPYQEDVDLVQDAIRFADASAYPRTYWVRQADRGE